MLPDVDTDDGDMSEEGVLVGSGHNLKTLVRGVVSLHQQREETVVLTSRLKRRLTSQPQPEPWIPAVIVLNSF